MININPADNTALNTDTGQICAIVWIKGKAYTNAAGIVALEYGNFEGEQIRNILYTRQYRKSKPFFELVKPLDFNGDTIYLVSGWEQFRKKIIVRTPNK